MQRPVSTAERHRWQRSKAPPHLYKTTPTNNTQHNKQHTKQGSNQARLDWRDAEVSTSHTTAGLRHESALPTTWPIHHRVHHLLHLPTTLDCFHLAPVWHEKVRSNWQLTPPNSKQPPCTFGGIQHDDVPVYHPHPPTSVHCMGPRSPLGFLLRPHPPPVHPHQQTSGELLLISQNPTPVLCLSRHPTAHM